MIKHFYFVRHGRTDWNVMRLIQGQVDRKYGFDIPLNKEGVEQAKALIPFFKERNLEVIISSPCLRAAQTATIVAENLQVPVFFLPALREMFFGYHEGTPVDYFKTLYFGELMMSGEELRKRHKSVDPNYDDLRHPGGESKREVRARFIKGLKTFALNSPYTYMAVPCHNAALRFFLSEIDRNEAAVAVGHGELISIDYDINKDKFEFIERTTNTYNF